ncbi:MAG: lysophospholipase [Candidatus Omnitrophica bacterium]|nr:lysophospholipase [Candidatus Omnitrophota bacterium]
MWTEHRFVAFDGTPIFYRRARCSGDRRGIVLVVHGMGEHSGRYEHVARYFSERGWESVLPDLRGFGKSGGPRAFAGCFSDFHRDLGALHRYTAGANKGIPIFFLGHSFGGLVASSYLAFCGHPGAAGLVLSSPIFGLAFRVPKWKHGLAFLASYLLPRCSQKSPVEPAMLTHDPAAISRYNEDLLVCHRVSSRLYAELVRMMGRKEEIARRLDCPVLVLQAGEDKVVSKDEAVSFYERLASSNKELKVYPSYYHEILNEAGKEKVLSDAAHWMEDRLKASLESRG